MTPAYPVRTALAVLSLKVRAVGVAKPPKNKTDGNGKTGGLVYRDFFKTYFRGNFWGVPCLQGVLSDPDRS